MKALKFAASQEGCWHNIAISLTDLGYRANKRRKLVRTLFTSTDVRTPRVECLPSTCEAGHGKNVRKEKIESPQKSEEIPATEGKEGPPSGEKSTCATAGSGGRWREADL